jgi:hypothetical protein
MSKKINHIVLNCSPHLGLLDNWLPILYQIKLKHPDIRFTFVAPVEQVIKAIDLQSSTIEVSSEIFSSVIFKTCSGSWVCVKNFSKAKEISKKYRCKFLNIIKFFLHRVNADFLKFRIENMQLKVSNFFLKKYIFDLENLQDFVLCFDLTDSNKKYNQTLMELAISKQKFSIFHGLNVNGMRGCTSTSNNYSLFTMVYSYSAKENFYYQKKFMLKSEAVHSYGIPRHNANWISFLKSKEANKDSSFDEYVLFISRPIGATISNEERIGYLLNIKKMLNKLNLKLVIKRHPKESNDKVFEKIFGKENYLSTWEYSSQNLLTHGDSCKFAVCLYSGVPLDLLMIGIPTIEMLDLKNVKHYEAYDLLKNKYGDPVTECRYFGFVLGASNYNQLEHHAIDVMLNKNLAVSNLLSNYHCIFPSKKNIINKISDEIFHSMEKKC